MTQTLEDPLGDEDEV